MPVSKPSEYLTWNPSLSNVLEPPSGLKSTGWTPGEEPPAQYTNWQINLIDQWIQWLDQQTSSNTVVITTSTSITQQNKVVLANSSGGAFNVTLPLAASSVGFATSIANIGLGSGNNITILPSGSDTIQGDASTVLEPGQSVSLASDGSGNYWQLGA